MNQPANVRLNELRLKFHCDKWNSSNFIRSNKINGTLPCWDYDVEKVSPAQLTNRERRVKYPLEIGLLALKKLRCK